MSYLDPFTPRSNEQARSAREIEIWNAILEDKVALATLTQDHSLLDQLARQLQLDQEESRQHAPDSLQNHHVQNSASIYNEAQNSQISDISNFLNNNTMPFMHPLVKDENIDDSYGPYQQGNAVNTTNKLYTACVPDQFKTYYADAYTPSVAYAYFPPVQYPFVGGNPQTCGVENYFRQANAYGGNPYAQNQYNQNGLNQPTKHNVRLCDSEMPYVDCLRKNSYVQMLNDAPYDDAYEASDATPSTVNGVDYYQQSSQPVPLSAYSFKVQHLPHVQQSGEQQSDAQNEIAQKNENCVNKANLSRGYQVNENVNFINNSQADDFSQTNPNVNLSNNSPYNSGRQGTVKLKNNNKAQIDNSRVLNQLPSQQNTPLSSYAFKVQHFPFVQPSDEVKSEIDQKNEKPINNNNQICFYQVNENVNINNHECGHDLQGRFNPHNIAQIDADRVSDHHNSPVLTIKKKRVPNVKKNNSPLLTANKKRVTNIRKHDAFETKMALAQTHAANNSNAAVLNKRTIAENDLFKHEYEKQRVKHEELGLTHEIEMSEVVKIKRPFAPRKQKVKKQHYSFQGYRDNSNPPSEDNKRAYPLKFFLYDIEDMKTFMNGSRAAD